MDLSKFNLQADSEKGARLQLRHPQLGTPLGVFVNVLGPDSRVAKAASAEMMRNIQSITSDEETEKRAARYAAAVTTGWENFLWEGKQLDFSREAAEEVYSKQAWIRHQVEAFQGNRGNFFNGSGMDSSQQSTTSSTSEPRTKKG